jgi:hypothetical protein
LPEFLSGYDPNALKSRKMTTIAVTPWTTTPTILAGLNALDLPRATPTIIPTIQAAEKSQTIIVATHHHISITSFLIERITRGTMPTPYKKCTCPLQNVNLCISFLLSMGHTLQPLKAVYH